MVRFVLLLAMRTKPCYAVEDELDRIEEAERDVLGD
jgi:hypothetical protein